MTDSPIAARVREWLAVNWSPARAESDLLAWRQAVHAEGMAAPSWPATDGGMGLGTDEAKLVEREFKRAGAPGSGQDRTNIAANTVRLYGTAAARADLLADLTTGKLITCLLYSEPGAGSDLAAVRTRAVRDGDNYVVTGQKVWTSRAQESHYGLLLARTDWDVPKHAGLSFFIIPMKQPGIEIRPIHQINGESHFNEVFLDAALVSSAYLLGAEGDGWKIMNTALAYERLIMAEGAAERRAGGDESLALLAFARDHGALADPVLRQEIAQAIAWRRIGELNAIRAKRTAADGGSSSLMSLGKLAMSRVLHNDARVRRKILGAEALFDDDQKEDAKDANFRSMHAYMNSIGGGTDQIQRNIIAERVLGLPREIETDRAIAFKDSLASAPGR